MLPGTRNAMPSQWLDSTHCICIKDRGQKRERERRARNRCFAFSCFLLTSALDNCLHHQLLHHPRNECARLNDSKWMDGWKAKTTNNKNTTTQTQKETKDATMERSHLFAAHTHLHLFSYPFTSRSTCQPTCKLPCVH